MINGDKCINLLGLGKFGKRPLINSWFIIFAIFVSFLAFGQTTDKTPSENETTHIAIPSSQVTDVKPVGDFKYPPFQEAERKQQEMKKQMFEETRKEVNAYLEKYLSALPDTNILSGDFDYITRIGYSDNPLAYQYLIKALSNKNTNVVAAAAYGLRIYSDKRAIKELLPILDKNTERARLEIATTLFALGERKKSVEVLTYFLRDSLLWRWTEATYRLTDELSTNPDAFTVLSQGLENQKPKVQLEALSNFMIVAGYQYKTFPIILSALKDKRQVFRQAALEGILDRKMVYGPLSCKDALPLLKKLSKDENLDWDSRTRARVFAEDIEESIAKEKK